MENEDFVEKEESKSPGLDLEAFRSSRTSRRKSIKEKIITAALVTSFMVSGCSTSKGIEETKEHPLSLDSLGTVVDLEEEEELKDEVEKLIPPLVEPNNSFQINVSQNVVEQIDVLQSKEGEKIAYPVWQIEKGGPRVVQSIRDFVDSVALTDVVENQAKAPYDFDYIEWGFDNGLVYYNNMGHSFLDLDFTTPVDFEGLEVDLSDDESLEKFLEDLDSKFFQIGFEHRVDGVLKQGDYYKVNYSRLLDGIPIYNFAYPSFLTFTQDGKLKEGRIWMAGFKKTDEVTLLSGTEIIENINNPTYPKSVVFENLEEDTDFIGDGFPRFFQHHLWRMWGRDRDGGDINLEDLELVYYFKINDTKGRTYALPMFKLKGTGEVKWLENLETNFEVLANALELKYIPPETP